MFALLVSISMGLCVFSVSMGRNGMPILRGVLVSLDISGMEGFVKFRPVVPMGGFGMRSINSVFVHKITIGVVMPVFQSLNVQEDNTLTPRSANVYVLQVNNGMVLFVLNVQMEAHGMSQQFHAHVHLEHTKLKMDALLNNNVVVENNGTKINGLVSVLPQLFGMELSVSPMPVRMVELGMKL